MVKRTSSSHQRNTCPCITRLDISGVSDWCERWAGYISCARNLRFLGDCTRNICTKAYRQLVNALSNSIARSSSIQPLMSACICATWHGFCCDAIANCRRNCGAATFLTTAVHPTGCDALEIHSNVHCPVVTCLAGPRMAPRWQSVYVKAQAVRKISACSQSVCSQPVVLSSVSGWLM